MRRFVSIVLLAWPAVLVQGQAPAQPAAASPLQASLNTYCVGCHNDKVQRGSLNLSRLDPHQQKPEDAVVWEKAIKKVRAGMMPPAGARRPNPAGVEALASAIESAVDKAVAAAPPDPGRPALHRLNQSEYANSVRDMFGLEINTATLLPPDDISHGFDNVAEGVTLSPTLMESYLRAADAISRLAVGDQGASPRVETYRVPQTFSQNEHVEGTPLGTRGGIAVTHNFPADGEYVFGMAFYHYSGKFFGALQEKEQLDIAIDGERVALLDVNLKMTATDELRTPPIKVKAGPHAVSVAFISNAQGPVLDFIQPLETALNNLAAEVPGVTGLLHVTSLGIKGPTNVTGAGDTVSRRKIFSCRPAAASEESACARRIVTALAHQALRRPIRPADVDHLMRLFQEARQKEGNFDAGIRMALKGVLADPEFVFRLERTPANTAAGTAYRVNDFELATRLSYFLWSSTPDDKLLTLAAQGRLREPAVLTEQVRRMLADSRADALSKNFASQWLHLRNLRDWHPDPFVYPDADRNLLNSMERETELFFMSIVREDRNVLDLLTADYTFIDGRLARHYKIPNVVGDRFRRVPVVDENRKGLLGHASILTVTSLPTRTSPVVRGKWVLDNLLGAPPPQPPPEVPPLKENTADVQPVSLRARLQEHRANPTCAACHAIMDPIGFALETFDAVGASRQFDSGERIDPAGQLVDGTKLDGPKGIQQALLGRSELLVRTFTEKLLTYALGRGLEPRDMSVVRSIVRSAHQSNDRVSSVILGIVNSAPFQMRTAEAAATN